MRRLHLFPVSAIALATFLAVVPAYAVGVDPGKATPVQREQAQSRFLRGRELFGQRQFARALEEFEASRDIVASPNARLYSARCLRELGDLVAAYSEFGRTAIEARELSRDDPRYARTGTTAEEERKAIAPLLGFLAVTIEHASDNTTLRVDKEEIRRSGWSEPIPAAPGTVEIALETPGRQTLRQDVPLAAGETKEVSFDADGAPPLADASSAAAPSAPATTGGALASHPQLRTAAFVSMGVGVAGLATFVVFGSLANAKYGDLDTSCSGGPCPPARQGDIDAGRRDQTIANVGLAVGLAGAAGAVALFVLSASPKAAAPHAAVVIRPGGIGVSGAF